MKFIKVIATQSKLQEVEIFLNTDLIKMIGTDGAVYLRNDPNDTHDGHLIIGDMEYISLRINDDIKLNTSVL